LCGCEKWSLTKEHKLQVDESIVLKKIFKLKNERNILVTLNCI